MQTREADTTEKAKRLFRRYGGTLRTTQAIRLGIHPRILYHLRDTGVVEPLGRGLYRLADLPPLSNQDLVTVALKIPAGVICMISALAFHDLTTQIPHDVDVALEHGSKRPRLRFPPVHLYWFNDKAFTEGIETHAIDKVPVKVYGPEKTLADCFKYRNKIGLSIALEALRAWRKRKGFDIEKLLHNARVCRVEKIIQPYLEALG
jgi:predicted transcriptional regulator of viral defense system